MEQQEGGEGREKIVGSIYADGERRWSANNHCRIEEEATSPILWSYLIYKCITALNKRSPPIRIVNSPHKKASPAPVVTY